jgi:hypothetical protein
MIIFDATKHSYTNTFTSERYTSVTTVLGEFKPKFDADKFSRIVAEKQGVSQQIILDEWKANNKQSQEYGTNIHSIIEEYARTGIYEEENEDLIKAYKKAGDFTTKSGALFEHCVYNHEYKIAGTADIIYPNGSFFDVYDFKTNKKFNFFSKYDKYLLGPVAHLPDCEYSSYSLQLSMYAYNYHLMTGRRPRQLSIFYWNRETKTFTTYPVAYLLNDIKNILKAL